MLGIKSKKFSYTFFGGLFVMSSFAAIATTLIFFSPYALPFALPAMLLAVNMKMAIGITTLLSAVSVLSFCAVLATPCIPSPSPKTVDSPPYYEEFNASSTATIMRKSGMEAALSDSDEEENYSVSTRLKYRALLSFLPRCVGEPIYDATSGLLASDDESGNVSDWDSGDDITLTPRRTTSS